jgi:hypothetical protein
MDGFFSNYRINKDVDRTGVNLLMRTIRKKTKVSSVIVFSAVNQFGEQANENWTVIKQNKEKYKFTSYNEDSDFLKLSKNFRTTILNYLANSDSLVIILICNMKQKIDNKRIIKEMWGFKLENKKQKTIFTEITSEDIYKYSTTSAYTGKKITPQKELVYCGPDGKICGWDMI